MRHLSFLLLLVTIASLYSCKKDELGYALTVTPHYHIDGQELILDTIMYQNAAGNLYCVNRLRYYLSNFRFVRSDGSEVIADDGVYFIDAREETEITLPDVPTGSFKELRFNFGIPADLNVYGNLPNTSENVGMVWPEQMGGGYHFMKFEGYFSSSTGTDGYAIHIGNNACLADISIATLFDVDADGSMTIGFNLNEILANPNTFDMDSGNYTMGIMPAMLEISANMHNAFTFEQTP
ncbi:MAG: hypothetical protein KDB98_14235, partial [Flavobacteriales bacterium]|nr:hypothetical protein [Flavobacteriales bacterium]